LKDDGRQAQNGPDLVANPSTKNVDQYTLSSTEKERTAMRNSRRGFLTALPGFVLVQQAMCAFASGREGAALVEPVRWILAIVLVAFATLVIGGGLLGAFRASQSSESILKGSARGLLKGMVAFLVVSAVSVAGLTILGILWIAYSFLSVYVLSPS
jgi:hypothetical protein